MRRMTFCSITRTILVVLFIISKTPQVKQWQVIHHKFMQGGTILVALPQDGQNG